MFVCLSRWFAPAPDPFGSEALERAENQDSSSGVAASGARAKFLAVRTLRVIDFLSGDEACGAHFRCPFTNAAAAAAATVIYGPPVARTSDL